MTFDSFDAVLLTTIFLVPGFVWSAVLSMRIPRRATSVEVRVLEFLTLSCINHACWIWLIVPAFKWQYLQSQPIVAGLVLLFPLLVSPIAFGVLTVRYVYDRDWLKRFLGRFGFRTIHPIPTAWDYYFSQSEPCWTVVTLQNGSQVYGLFHQRSFAGDDPDERDLYIEAVFRPNDSGEWAPVEDTGGILIKANQIASIEFRKL